MLGGQFHLREIFTTVCHIGLKNILEIWHVVFSVERKSPIGWSVYKKINVTDVEDKMLKGPESPLLNQQIKGINIKLTYFISIYKCHVNMLS